MKLSQDVQSIASVSATALRVTRTARKVQVKSPLLSFLPRRRCHSSHFEELAPALSSCHWYSGVLPTAIRASYDFQFSTWRKSSRLELALDVRFGVSPCSSSSTSLSATRTDDNMDYSTQPIGTSSTHPYTCVRPPSLPSLPPLSHLSPLLEAPLTLFPPCS
jgi:hypothetical protein